MANAFRWATLSLTLGTTALIAGMSSADAQAQAPITSPAPAPAMSAAPAMSSGAGSAPQAMPSTAPAPDLSVANPPENTLVTARVGAEFTAWQHGRINRTTYSPNAGGVYIDPLIALTSPELEAIGPLQSVTYRTASLLLGNLVYRYEVTGTSGVISVLYSLDGRGKTDGIVFTPLIFRTATSP